MTLANFHHFKNLLIEEFSAITNAGLRVIVDINNKKSEVQKDIHSDFDDILSELEKSLKNLTAEFKLEELI